MAQAEGQGTRGRLSSRARWMGSFALRAAGVAWGLGLLVLVGALVAIELRGDRVDAVLTGSMSPAIPTGSLVVSGRGPIEAGDVIVYEQARSGRLVTHRVVHVVAGDGGPVYTTKGDANPTVDIDPVPAADVRGRVLAHVPGLGAWLQSWRGPSGVAVLVGPPLLALAASGLSAVVRRRGTGSVTAAPTNVAKQPRREPC